MFSGRVAGGDWLGGEEDAGLFSVIVDTAHLTLDWDRESEARELAGPGPGPWPAPVTRPPDPRCPLSLSLGPVSGPGVEAGKYRKKHFAREVWMRFNRLQINQVRFRNRYICLWKQTFKLVKILRSMLPESECPSLLASPLFPVSSWRYTRGHVVTTPGITHPQVSEYGEIGMATTEEASNLCLPPELC